MSSSLESEDLEIVQLVRMEDVQPSRERPCEDPEVSVVRDEDLETCIVDNFEYDNECVVDGNDEDNNIGSMVSIHSEEVVVCDDSSTELIVPEIVAPKKVVEEIKHNVSQKPKKSSIPGPESWPTLEILPGGVINHLEKYEDDLTSICTTDKGTEMESGEMMYACAKCPQRFQYLCSLVKHVRWHALEQKKRKPEPAIWHTIEQKRKDSNLSTACERTRGAARLKKNYVCLKTSKVSPVVLTKTCKKKVVKILPKKPKS